MTGFTLPHATILVLSGDLQRLLSVTEADPHGHFRVSAPAGAYVLAKFREDPLGAAGARATDGVVLAPGPAFAVAFEAPSGLTLEVMPRAVPGLPPEGANWLYQRDHDLVETALTALPLPVTVNLQAGEWLFRAQDIRPSRPSRPGGEEWARQAVRAVVDGRELERDGSSFVLDVRGPCRVTLE